MTTDEHPLYPFVHSDSLIVYGIVLILLVIVLQRLTANNRDQTVLLSSEAKRRIQHGMTGCLLVLISYCLPVYMCLLLLIMATYTIYSLKTYHFHTIYLPNFGPLLRDHEKQAPSTDNPSDVSSSSSSNSMPHAIPLPGAFYFLLGTTITTMLFPIHLARYSVLCLSLADPMAAYIGQCRPSYRLDQIRWLQRMIRIMTPSSSSTTTITTNATLSGCMACFITSWMIGYICFILPHDTATTTTTNTLNHPIMSITAGAMACSIAEAIPFVGNDNLQIPIFTALIVTVVSW